jgi:HK97 family phage prohead protease
LPETKTLPIGFELKAVSGRTIEGYAAAWARDRVNDIIDPKAFNRTIQANPDVAIFVGHDSTKLPVGEPIEMRADSHGLFTRSLIYDTPDGNALLEVAKARLSKGKTLGMSIGFRTVKDHWDAKQKARILEDVDLIEYSFLASPGLAANPQAVALGVKAKKATSLVDESYEDLQGDLSDAATAALGGYCCVVATFPDHVIVMSMTSGDSDGEYWDFPYTLDSDMEPTLGEPKPVQQAFVDDAAEARGKAFKATLDAAARNALSSGDYAYTDSSGGQHLPVNDAAHVRAAMARFNQTHFESPAKRATAARKIISRARALGIDVSADSAVAQAAKGVSMDLEDSAFAYIDSGGVLDPEHQTVPRSARHVPHHNPDGSVDIDVVREFLEAPGDEHKAIGHMMAHAWDAGLFGLKSTATYDRTVGASRMFLEIAYKALVLADRAAADRWAMTRSGLDTHEAMRLYDGAQTEAKALGDLAYQVVKRAQEIDRGEDGAALANTWRTAFELLDLEEVA